MDPGSLAALDQVVDVNAASAEELTSLPGIGPKRAAAIIAARPFARVDELTRVRGVGPKTLARVRARARVGVPADPAPALPPLHSRTE
ncbi:helix-hairpin-helix domain-containing protein [Pseudenhygromyxa sp. WMMC2535]|nr:helix-hairpin-helix domain-containing protein [Pseudenhygromyxa sp. WMMC2535]